MRNPTSFEQAGNFDFRADLDPDALAQVHSPDQLVLIWTDNDEVIAASPVTNGGRGSFAMDLTRFPAGSDLGSAISLHRTRTLGLPVISNQTRFLTAVTDHSERTKMLSLDGEKLAYDDAMLLEWLINAERNMLAGADHHPVFETSLEDTACTVRRLPNGLVSMTEVHRPEVDVLESRMRVLAREYNPSLCIETPLRCAARYFLTVDKAGFAAVRPDKASETTAFIVMHRSGYSFGLWSPKAGLFSENAFLAPDEVYPRTDSLRAARRSARPETKREGIVQSTEEYIRKAFDQLMLHMAPEKLENLQLSTYSQVVWVAERGLADTVAPIAADYESRTGIKFVALSVPADEAIAGGLLLGSYSFGAQTAVGAQALPTINLARDILALADTEAVERRLEDERRLQGRRERAVLTILAPPVVVMAILLAFIGSLIISGFLNAVRESRADTRTEELRPALERRKSYEANLKWYQEFIAEVSKLRRQQPVTTGLLHQLDSNYPFAIDPSFYVSDLKLTNVGDVELKGLARNKDAVASFLKSLEFASGPESGSRLFSNLAYEVQEVAAPVAVSGQSRPPTLAGSTLSGTGVAPGVVIWSIKGNYLPVAGFNPKPAANQPGQTAPVASPKPAP